jgi:hypothetical protein
MLAGMTSGLQSRNKGHLGRRGVGVEVGRSAALLAVFVALGFGVAACGSGSPKAESNAAGLAISGCSPSGCSSPGASAAADAIAVKFSVCMRSHGVTEFPDPTIGSNGLPSWGPTPNVNGGAPAYTAAQQVCRKDLPSLTQTPAEKAKANAAALKYATCMRSNGEPNFPDPNGQGLIQVNATGALEPSSPAFQKAQTACKSLDNGFDVSVASASASPAPGGAESGS